MTINGEGTHQDEVQTDAKPCRAVSIKDIDDLIFAGEPVKLHSEK